MCPVREGANFFVFREEANRTAQCNEEHACRHFSDEKNLKFNS